MKIDLEKMKLSKTMKAGLLKMADKVNRWLRKYGPETERHLLPEPNELTGKALAKRGLLLPVPKDGYGWQYYTVTDLGFQVADAIKEARNED